MLPAGSDTLHEMAARALNRKILSGFYRPNFWRDFNKQE
jgi:hypothetical protein